MKKLSVFLIGFLVCMCAGFVSRAEQNDTYIYSVDESGNVTIQGYLNEISGDLVIPSEIDGNPVTSIARYVFQNCEITSVFIPASLSYIGPGAFSGCTGLTSIEIEEENEYFKVTDGILFSADGKTLCVYPASKTDSSYSVPEGVDTIGAGAFSGNMYIESVSLPNTVSVIDSRAFYNCANLNSIDLSKIIYIGDSAFYNCQSLTEAEFSESLTTVDSYAFEGCVGLTRVELPDSLIFVNEAVFRACTALESVIFGAETQQIGYQAFYGCIALTAVDIPDTVNSIAESAFAYCTSLAEVNVGTGLESIGPTVFQGCTLLESAVFNGDSSPENVGQGVFDEADNVMISFPNSPQAQIDFEEKLSQYDVPETAEDEDVIIYDQVTSSGLSQTAKTVIVVSVCAVIVIAAILIVCIANREKKDTVSGYRNQIDEGVLSPAPDSAAESIGSHPNNSFESDMEPPVDSVSIPDTPEEFRIEESGAEAAEKIDEIREYIDSVEIHGQLRQRRRNPQPVSDSGPDTEGGTPDGPKSFDPSRQRRRREVPREDDQP